jgi:hypothetical protein
MNIWSILALLIPIALSGQERGISLDQSEKEATLELVFVTALGDSITSGPNISVQKLIDRKPVAEWKGERVMKLKYGTYHLRVQYSGALPVDKDVKVEQPYQAVLICFFLGPIESPWEGNLVRGHIPRDSVRNDCRLVRFISPFADGAMDTKASQAGDFGLENVRPGRYLVMTLGEHGLCDTAEVIILFGERVKDLSISWNAHVN